MTTIDIITFISSALSIGVGTTFIGAGIWGFLTMPTLRTFVEIDDEQGPLKIMLTALIVIGIVMIYGGVTI